MSVLSGSIVTDIITTALKSKLMWRSITYQDHSPTAIISWRCAITGLWGACKQKVKNAYEKEESSRLSSLLPLRTLLTHLWDGNWKLYFNHITKSMLSLTLTKGSAFAASNAEQSMSISWPWKYHNLQVEKKDKKSHANSQKSNESGVSWEDTANSCLLMLQDWDLQFRSRFVFS